MAFATALLVATPSLDAEPLQAAAPAAATSPEPDATSRFFPFTLPDNTVQPVKDGMVLSYVIGLLLGGIGGTFWGPMLAVKGGEMSSDAFINGLVPWVLGVLGCAAISAPCGLFTYGIGSVVGLPILLIGYYFSTNAVLATMDRQMKAKGPAGRKDPPAGTQPSPGQQPEPGYAY